MYADVMPSSSCWIDDVDTNANTIFCGNGVSRPWTRIGTEKSCCALIHCDEKDSLAWHALFMRSVICLRTSGHDVKIERRIRLSILSDRRPTTVALQGLAYVARSPYLHLRIRIYFATASALAMVSHCPLPPR